MVRTLSALLLTILATGCAISIAPSTRDLDQKNGFRDATFGTPVTAFRGLEEIDRDGGITSYRRKGDELRIGEAQLDFISYGFYRGRLYRVMLHVKGHTNSRALLRALQASYGLGSQSNPYIESYVWLGRAVQLVFSEDAFGESASAALISAPIERERSRDQKTAAAKAASDL